MATPKAGYYIDGERVPGTTTVIGRFKDSGGLLYWAFGQGKLAEQGKIQKLYDKAEEAADIGTQAHEAIERYFHGEEPIIDGMAKGAIDAYQNAMKWLEQTKIEIVPELQEVQLVSPTYKFGGTPDAIGRIGDELVLLDWKTSNSVYQDYLIQLAAYRHLVEDGVRVDTGELLGIKLSGGAYLCRFSKDFPDFGAHYYGELDSAWRQFQLFREAYEIDKTLKQRTK